MRAQLHDLMVGRDGSAILSIRTPDKEEAEALFDEFGDADVEIKIGKLRQKRSLDANAYCFVLIGKIAEKLNVRKEDVYRAAVKEIGGNYDIVCVQNEAVEQLCRAWSGNGIGWQSDTLPSKIEGCTNVVLYYGSSTYDTRQMHRLISVIVDDCKELGIETRTPTEIESLLKRWGE